MGAEGLTRYVAHEIELDVMECRIKQRCCSPSLIGSAFEVRREFLIMLCEGKMLFGSVQSLCSAIKNECGIANLRLIRDDAEIQMKIRRMPSQGLLNLVYLVANAAVESGYHRPYIDFPTELMEKDLCYFRDGGKLLGEILKARNVNGCRHKNVLIYFVYLAHNSSMCHQEFSPKRWLPQRDWSSIRSNFQVRWLAWIYRLQSTEMVVLQLTPYFLDT